MAELLSPELEQDRRRLFSTGQAEAFPETGYPLFSKNTIPNISNSQAEQRAAKYHLSLGEKSPGYDEVLGSIKGGFEGDMRRHLAEREKLREHQIRLDIIDSLAKEGQLNETTEEFVRAMSFPTDVDPSTHLEKQYARFVLNKTLTFDEDSPLPQSFEENPEATHQILDAGEHVIAVKEAGLKLLEELQGDFAQKGFFGKAYEFGEMMVPFRTWIKLNDSMEGAPTSALLPGDNLKQQMQYLYSLPTDRAIKELRVAVKQMAESNQLEAMTFLEYMLTPSSDLRILENVFAGVDVVDLGLVAGGIGAGVVRGARRGARGVGRVTTEEIEEISFKTSKGSVYRVREGGVTIRDKAFRPEHGRAEQGIQPASERTFYISKEDSQKLALVQARGGNKTAIDIRGNQAAVHFTEGPDAGKPIKDTVVDIKSEPQKGLIPVEIWQGGTKVHFGNVITEVTRTRRTVPSKTEELSQATRDIIEATGGRVTKAERVMEAAGDIDGAATKKALEEMRADLTVPESVFRNMERQIAGIYNNKILMGVSEGISNERTRRILQQISVPRRLMGLKGSVTDIGRDVNRLLNEKAAVQTIPNEVIPEVFESAKRRVNDEFTDMPDAVLGIRPAFGRPDIIPEDVGLTPQAEIANTLQVEVQIGRTNGELFGNRGSAVSMARNFYRLEDGSYDIKQQGLKFYIRTFKDVDLTTREIRDKWIGSQSSVPPDQMLNSFIGLLRTPADTMSQFDRGARETIVHATGEMRRLTENLTTNLRQLHGPFGKTKARRVADMLELSRDMQNPVTKDKGYWFRSTHEFDVAYRDKFGELPSVKEVAAYFEGKRLSDIDYLMRNIVIYKGKARQGIQNNSIRFATKKDDKLVKVFSEPIEGRYVDESVLNTNRTFHLAFVDESTGKTTRHTSSATGFDKESFRRAIAQDGYKIIQIANPLDFPMTKGFGLSGEVNYVLAKTIRSSPLQLRQIPYREGGHIKYRFRHWVKQPILETKRDGRVVYLGDRTISNHSTRKEAQLFEQNLQKAIDFYNDGDFQALDNLLNSGALPWSMKEFSAMIKRGALSGSKVTHLEGSENAATKLRLADAHGAKFDNRYESPFNLYDNVSREFAQERSERLPGIKFEGDTQNPVFKFTGSKLVDPLEVLGRAANSVMDTHFLQDYIQTTAENFVANFSDVLRPSLEELRRNPLVALYNGDFKTNVSADLQPLKRAAEDYRKKSLLLLNQEKPFDKQIRVVKERLLDSVFSSLGQPTADWLSASQLFTTIDPFKFTRSMAFNLKLGLFTPVQLFLQAQTLSVMAGIAGPRLAGEALPAATMMRWLGVNSNEAILNDLSQKMRHFGWNPDDFKEMYSEMRRSGIFNVEGEVANLDNQFEATSLFRGPFGKTLQAGQLFFREGERFPRLASYAAAYKEWRDANKFAKMNVNTRAAILRRAKDMTVNQTRDAQARWQQGVFSIPTQFFSYQLRLMELTVPALFGKGRIKRAEAARIMAFNSLLYGIPVGTLGTTLGFFWPWNDDIRQAALERGMSIDEGAWEVMWDGAYSEIIEGLLGVDVDFASRYGPSGLDVLKEALWTKEQGVLEVMLGASGSIAGDIFESVDPMYRSLSSLINPNEEDTFLAADFINASTEISTVNQFARMFYALNTGKYVTTNGITLGEATPADAIFNGIAGTTLQSVSDVSVYFESMREDSDNFKAHKKEIAKYIRFMVEAERQGDDKLANDFRKRVRILMELADIRPDQKSAIISEAVRNFGTAEDAKRSFILNAPPSQRQQRERLMRNN